MAGSLIGAIAAPLIGGVVSSALGGGSQGTTMASNGAAQAADPFASERPQYQKMLHDLMTNPDSFKQSANSQAVTRQGMSSLDANMASKGLANSGAGQAALAQYSTMQAGTDYNQQIANLMTMSGAGQGNLGAASNVLAGQQQSNDQAISTFSGLVGRTLGGSPGLQGMLNPSAGDGTDMTGFRTQPSTPWNSAPATNNLGSGTYDYSPINSGGTLGSGAYDFSSGF